MQLNQSLLDWKNKGSMFDYKGYSIYSQTGGKQNTEALLLIHGFPTSSWDMEEIWKKLSTKYLLFTIDMIGFGFSDKPLKYNYSIHDQADLFETFLLKHKINSCHILAHDYGDTVAQELLARQNSGVLSFEIKSVCLLNGGLFPETHKALFSQKLLNSIVGPIISKLISRKSFTDNMNNVFGRNTKPSANILESFWQLMNYKQGKRIMHLLIKYITERRIYSDRWRNALKQSLIPIQLINGIDDPISGKHMVERYKEVISDKNIFLLIDIGHYPQVEAPKMVYESYIKFRSEIS